MNDIDIDYLTDLTGEDFYKHIDEKYGKLVKKFLQFYDIDSYNVLYKINLQELIDPFEKLGENVNNNEFVKLQDEICVVLNGCISLKAGTKQKLISLLKSTHDIIKKKRSQLRHEARINRNSQNQSTSSSTDDNSTNLNQYVLKCQNTVKESLHVILAKTNGSIHAGAFTAVSVTDFEINVKHTSDFREPICCIRCICGDHVKLYYKHQRFQLSNLSKHMNLAKNHQRSRSDTEMEQVGHQQPVIHTASSTNQTTQSTVMHTSAGLVHGGGVNTKVTTTYESESEEIEIEETRVTSGNIKDGKSTAGSSNKKQTINGTQCDEDQTCSSNRATSSMKKKQTSNNSKQQTTTTPPNYQHLKVLQPHDKNLSQPKKRKYNENDDRNKTKSTTRKEFLLDNIDQSDILSDLLESMRLNANRTPNNYRYSDSVLRFAGCVLILAGAYVYDFLRLNFKYLLPSTQTASAIYKKERYAEAQFRFDQAAAYLQKNECKFVFLSEDCSGIIPRIEYDAILNIFNGFATPIIDGKPIVNNFHCESFEQLKDLFENQPRSNLINIHVLQPILNGAGVTPSPTVLAAYGTDSKISSTDIIKRWILMYFELRSRNIYILGFSTDGDPKCLRAMRLVADFFVKNRTLKIYNDNLSFTAKIPSSWRTWYFLDANQLFLFMQDGVHLCNKMRNRLLSDKVHLHMTKFKVSIKHLYELIKTTNKIDSNLSKSDLKVKDKQNFSSCQRISSEKVLNLLSSQSEYNGTYNYLLIINLLITAYTEHGIRLSTRIFYAWIVVFFVRLWRIWLYKSRKIRQSFNRNVHSDPRNYFITSNALLSIELNAHTLIFISLLIDQNLVPASVANSIHLFSSQPCEAVFRDARSLSGIYSTRINFTVQQFLQRLNKLNALTEIKQFERQNNQSKIIFPVHHKLKRIHEQADMNSCSDDDCFDSDYIEDIILLSYESAQQMIESVGMDVSLKKHKLFDMNDSSKIAKQLLELNTLSESEILILDGQENENSDEEDGFVAGEENEGEEDDNGDDENDAGDDEDNSIDTDTDDQNQDRSDSSECENIRMTDNGTIVLDHIDDSSEDDQSTTITFETVQSSSYSGLRLVQSVPPVHAHKYFTINVHNKKMFLHKATAAWYMQEKQTHVPNDRLQRVQFREM